jgi:hypothetical protein
VKIPAKINFLELGRASYGTFKKSSSGYQLTGNIKLNVPKVGEKAFLFPVPVVCHLLSNI